MEESQCSWCQPIHSETLKRLLESITDEMSLSTSESSFAHQLLNEVKKDQFISGIKSLATEVKLNRMDSTVADQDEYGKVYVCKVQVKRIQKELTVEKVFGCWYTFRYGKQKEAVKVILISSKSIRVVETKLRVYREFQSDIDSHNILLQHENEENFDEISKLSASKKTSGFTGIVEVLRKSIPSTNLPTILDHAADRALRFENVQRICFAVDIKDEGKHVGTVDHSPYVCYSMFTVKRIKKMLFEETLRGIGELLGSEICIGILQHIESQIKRELKSNIIHLEINVSDELYVSVTLIVMTAIVFAFSSWLGVIVAVCAVVYTVVMSVDINSKGWRTQVANEVYLKLREKREEILKSILPQIETVCRNTEKDLGIVAKNLKRFQERIPLFNQREAVKTWKERDFLKDLPGLAKYPNVLTYIAGHKNKSPTIKVFLSSEDIEARLFFTRISSETFYRFEFVVIDKKSKKRMGNTNKKQELNSDVRQKLGQTIKNQGEKVYANHSSVVGLGIGTTNSYGSNTPCIIIFCLDKDLIPYGEKPLPKYLDGWHCEIKEDIVMFGGCFDCRQIAHPNPGCCIGSPSIGFGSAGFLVKNKGTQEQASGFLTAAHVAAENWHDLYDSNTLLSKLGVGHLQNKIVHNAIPNQNSGQVIGTVMESFCGNWEGTGIDAAFVQIAEQTRGEYTELQIVDERNLKFNGTTRVIKRGCRTGETEGVLVDGDFSLCVELIKHSGQTGSFVYFNQCFAIEDIDRSFFDQGDSGSGVFVLENGKPTRPLGIAFANRMITQTTAVCRIDPVIRAFKLCIYDNEEPMEL